MRRLWLSCISVLVAGVALGEDGALHARLMDAAEAAAARGDDAEVQRVLRGWASLSGASGAVPSAMAEAAEAARRWAGGVSPLRIYASRVSPERVRVGVDDPAEIIDRLDVFSRGLGGLGRLTRAESEAAGRNEYLVPPSAAGPLVVRGVLLSGTAEIVVYEVELAPSKEALPTAPTAPAPAPAPASSERVPQIVPSPPEPAADGAPSVAWWWVVAAGAAAALVGAAVWQETRF